MHWYHSHPSARGLQARTAIRLDRRDRSRVDARPGVASRDLRLRPRPGDPGAACGGGQRRRCAVARAARERVDRSADPLCLAGRASTPDDEHAERPVSPHDRPRETGLPVRVGRSRHRTSTARSTSRKGDPGIVVGVIDTGVDNVPDLKGKIDSLWTVSGTTVSQAPPEGNDDVRPRHRGRVGDRGERRRPLRHGRLRRSDARDRRPRQHRGYAFFDDLSIAIALTKLDSLGVRIVNMSLGGRIPSEPILVDAIHKAAADGVLLVAASGNEPDAAATSSWPAADLQPADGGRSYGLPSERSTVDGQRASFSNWGSTSPSSRRETYGGLCSGVLVALPTTSAFDDNCSLTWMGEGGAHYGNLAGHLVRRTRGGGHCCADLGRAARAEELPGRRHHQAVRPPRRGRAGRRRWAAASSTPARRSSWRRVAPLPRGRSRSQATPCAPPAATEPPTWPTEPNQTITFDPIADKTLGDSDFAGQRRCLIRLAALVHGRRQLHRHGDHGAPDRGGRVLDHRLAGRRRELQPRAERHAELRDRRRSGAHGARPSGVREVGRVREAPVPGRRRERRRRSRRSRPEEPDDRRASRPRLLRSRRRTCVRAVLAGAEGEDERRSTASASRSPTARAGKPRPAVVASD